MTRDELNKQLLQLVTILRSALAANRDWDEITDWSRRLSVADTVFVAFSPGDHATTLLVTFADGGVTDLAPPDFDEAELPPPAELNPGDQRNALDARVRKLLKYLEAFTGWTYAGTSIKYADLRNGVRLNYLIRPDKSEYTVSVTGKLPPAGPGPDKD